MKKTQMIYSPRTFRLGLGLIVAAGLASMPVLTGAGEKTGSKASDSKSKRKSNSNSSSSIVEHQGLVARSGTKSKRQKKSPSPAERRLTDAEVIKPDGIQRRLVSAEARARVRAEQLERSAAKLGIRLTAGQRRNLISKLKAEIVSQSKKFPKSSPWNRVEKTPD